jgi:uncharacterized repeat protein (TIGR02543 family)
MKNPATKTNQERTASSKFARAIDFVGNLIAPSQGKRAKRQSALRAGVAASLVSIAIVGNLTGVAVGAQALSVDASQAAFNFQFPSNGTLLSGSSASADGAVVKFSNVTGTPLSGISIDAIVTNNFVDSNVTNYDNNGNASSNTDYFQVNTAVTNAGGTTSFAFDFYEAGSYSGPGTGTPVVLNNVSVTSIDIDGSSNFCQFSDFTGFQSYVLGANSSLQVETNATDSSVPVGTTRFLATSCDNNSNRVEDAVQVQFDSVTSFTAKFGTDRTSSPNYFGIAFKPLSAMFGVTPPAPVANPSNQPPTSNDTTRYVTTAEPSVIQLSDFGNFQDPDDNPFVKVQITTLPSAGSLEKFVNGNWVPVVLNDEFYTSDISNGTLRFTGSVDRSMQFKVSDGVVYSTSPYTMSLLVSAEGQVITFNNPGTKTPTTPAFASGATSTSGLPVTLTSLTPGVCTVSGTNITPVSAGLCTIVATQSGNSSYSAATPVTQTFPISTLTPQTITAANPGTKSFTGTPFAVTLAPTATSGLTVTMISQSPAVCTVSGFVVTIIGPGNCTIRNVQNGNGTYAPAPTVEFTFAVNTGVTNFAITYDGNGKDSGSSPANTTGNGSVTLASNSGTLALSGFTFTGWNTAANGTGTHYNVSATYNLTADITLYAEWAAVAANYTITYDGNGKDSGSSPANTTGNGNVTLASNSGTLALSGFTFTGWNTSANGTGTHYNVNATYNLTADVTLYAEWTAVAASYAINYDGNGEDSGTSPANTTGNGNVTLATNSGALERTGYTFVGWNTTSDGSGTHYDVSSTYNLVTSVKLYAEWELTPQVIYNPNGATEGTTPDSVDQGSPVVIDENTGLLSRAGFKFIGWNTKADGSGISFAPGETPTLPVGTVLYAQWEPIEALAETGVGNNFVLAFLGFIAILAGALVLVQSRTREDLTAK